jgi:hypothetical protein
MRRGLITPNQAIEVADTMGKSTYAAYLRRVAETFASEGR